MCGGITAAHRGGGRRAEATTLSSRSSSGTGHGCRHSRCVARPCGYTRLARPLCGVKGSMHFNTKPVWLTG